MAVCAPFSFRSRLTPSTERIPAQKCVWSVVVLSLVLPVLAAGDEASRYPYIPPAWEPYVALYHAFEQGSTEPEINRIGAVVTTARKPRVSTGVTGQGLTLSREEAKATPLRLKSPAFSPHRPITVSLWFRVDEPMQLHTCLHLMALRGRGHIANFVRGKGQWCALKQPTFVFQVHGIPGIPNRNDPWRGRAWFEPREWHHALMTVSNASDVSVYWDGRLRCHYTVRGRPFREGDMTVCDLGPSWLFHPMTIDDVLVLDRAVDADEVRDYVNSVRRLHEVAFPGKENGPEQTAAQE
ncbi:MAG: hypothetical protein HN976_44785 [Lentisphaerae bacterium]|nr:hypothetical protein [Lentisphaerota bacterium]